MRPFAFGYRPLNSRRSGDLMVLMWRALVSFSIRNRRRKATAIKAFMDARNCRTVLLVGESGSAQTQGYEDIVENTIIQGRTVLAGFNVFPVEGHRTHSRSRMLGISRSTTTMPSSRWRMR